MAQTNYNICAVQGDYFKFATIGNSSIINFTTKFKWVFLPYFFLIIKIWNQINKNHPPFFQMAVNFKISYGNHCILVVWCLWFKTQF